jgi:uncharacterized protein YpmS
MNTLRYSKFQNMIRTIKSQKDTLNEISESYIKDDADNNLIELINSIN